MLEKVTIIEMMLFAVVFGMTAMRLKGKALEIKSFGNKAVFAAIYIFSGYCFMGVGRLIFLRTGEFFSYTQDLRLLIFDILSGIAGVFLLPRSYMNTYRSQKENNFFVIPICIIMTFASVFIYQLIRYKNVNSAFYHCLIPEVISLIGLIVWIEIAVISHLTMKVVLDDSKRNTDKLSVTITFAFIITVCVYPYLETFLSNSEEFSFALKDILLYLIIFLTIVFAVIMVILNNLSGKIWEMTILGIFSFTLAAYIQALFLNRRLFLMDGVNREWTVGIKILNVIIWGIIFVGIFLLRYCCGENWKGILKFCCVAIVVMQLTGVFSLHIKNSGHFETRKESEYFSTNGLYEVAAEENVIVFVLDKYDGKYMQEVLDEEPDFLDPLKGFVSFPDTVAQFSRTYPAITYMLTNHTFFNVPSGENYINWAFDDCSFWKDLAEKDFHMYFYEEHVSYIGDSVKKQTDNYIEQGELMKKELSLMGCIRSIHTMNCYRIMPYIVKDYFSYTEDTINDLVISNKVWAQEQYEMDDAKIKLQLEESGLTINDDRKAFRFIHMFGAHPPYSLDRDGNRVGESKDLNMEQYMGSMQIVYNYLDELKRLGLYENATVIITADHGDNFENGNVLPEKVNVIMYIKPRGSSEEPLCYSETYAAQSDLLPTLAGAIGITADKEWGIDLLSDDASNLGRERVHYFHVVENMVQTAVRTYKIKGSSLDFNNWIATDEYNDFR